MQPLTELQLFSASGSTFDPTTWAPAGVRGADKVAQRFVYFLMTPQGSVPGRPNDGSSFSMSAQDFTSEFDLFAAFTSALPGVVAALRAAEALEGGAPSEQYGSASLAGVTITADVVLMSLSVTAADGSTPTGPVNVVFPI